MAVRAAGLNFRDVVVALGAIAEDGLGGEAAGIILDVAADVTAFRRGDAVMGLFPQNAFAPTAVTDHRMVVALPAGWSMPSAASVPVAVLTAYASLIEVGGLRAGQRVLIHAGAGGVGQAAIQIARHLGAEVYATAHPNKHHVLHQLGIADDHIASSRTLDFADKFTQTTGGRGMDLVLNSLTGDFVDRSLDLLGPGGCLVEIGKTDIRQPHAVATTHPGVSYHTYDLSKESPERASQLWQGVVEMITAGALHPLPTTSYGLLQAPRALRHMSQARHTGKIVLVPPPVFTPEGSVLITGGTGTLGALFAEHLITHYGVRHLLLVSRRGPQSPGATELSAHLNALGAQVTISAADTSNPTELAALLAAIPPAHPLTAIIHTAAVLQDAVLTELTPDQLHSVLTAKADTAWHLHHLTRHLPLDAFILFSSVSGVLGASGQANYAAANAFLDALAHHRHHHHQPATSLSWGYWQTTSAMTAHLDSTDQARLTRNHLAPITTDHGLALFDTALTYHRPHLIPAPLNHHSLTRHARQHGLAPLLSALTTTRRQASTTPTHHSLHTQLATQTPAQQHATLLALVTTTTATVLAHPDASALDPDQPFKDLGIDSLSALELRNTMAQHAGLTLPATLIFDHPTPTALTHYLHSALTSNTRAIGPLGQLLKAAYDKNQRSTLINVIVAASDLDPASSSELTSGSDLERSLLKPAQDAAVHLVCISEFSGQYQRFAHGFPDNVEVIEILAPGFSGTEPPASARESGQAILDALDLNILNRGIVIVGSGVTCIPALQLYQLLEAADLLSSDHQLGLVAMAPVNTSDTSSIGEDSLIMDAIATHLEDDADLIAFGRYLSFGLVLKDGLDKRILTLNPFVSSDMDAPVESPLTFEPATAALRVHNWLTDIDILI
ncbi:hypothetical protein AWC27_09660 [Mycobacterium szulgai]|uniref:Carrier domain-containing protein n=1 Tax=Mycobacterium szulgai TaxID=1787 RepID=A0A1X2DUN4_MYCSZ|nr:hypothetical protein AWC27_09660 [Mycobacterium szulgai]